ncbi:MAG: hypothetical protein LBM94_04515 [Propionibacteriaceae bacterium]|jgi:hypothetical protein|nr:hypothetical protein [Propionibacteriaceae bacterium]
MSQTTNEAGEAQVTVTSDSAIRRTNPLLLVGLTFIASRAMMALIGVISAVHNGDTLEVAAGHWDVGHFVRIATDGYADLTETAFFPGLPLLLRLANSLGIPMVLFGCLVSMVASWFAALALLRLYGPMAACLWLIAPPAVFTMIPYTEALFCAAAFWAWERAKADRWGWAATFAALSCTLRISGLFLWGALGLLAISQIRLKNDPDWLGGFCKKVAWLLLPLAVLGGYELYLHSLTGSWTTWLDAQQSGWARSFTSPWRSLQRTLEAGHFAYWPGRPDVAIMFRIEVLAMAIGLAATLICAWQKRLGEFGWVGIHVIAFGTSTWYISASRAVLLWFPLYSLLAQLTTWTPKNPRAKLCWRCLIVLGIAISAIGMCIWAWLFFNGKWSS